MNNEIYLEKFISNEKYCDFNDVLMLPQSSSLNSRSQVNLEKTIQFKKYTWTGIPIIAANMTTTGTFEV
jgi:GMP reductase